MLYYNFVRVVHAPEPRSGEAFWAFGTGGIKQMFCLFAASHTFELRWFIQGALPLYLGRGGGSVSKRVIVCIVEFQFAAILNWSHCT